MKKLQQPRMVLWQAPSGRLHAMRNCNGGATTTRNATKRRITQTEYDIAFQTRKLCRCASDHFYPESKR